MAPRQYVVKLVDDLLETYLAQKDLITVAELRSEQVNGVVTTVDTNTALISLKIVDKIKPSHTDPHVKTSAAYFNENYTYRPKFWLYLSSVSGLREAEPLAVAWDNGNHTTLTIDQGFLSSFNLTPRLADNMIFWDDLSKPQYGIVQNSPSSEYKFPIHSTAFVKVSQEYLQRYLSYRKKVAVQIFKLQTDISVNTHLMQLLNEEGYYIEEFENYEVRMSILISNKNVVRLEVNGYKLLFQDGHESKSDKDRLIGHYWKGIDGIVTPYRARNKMAMHYVYVSDSVLARYEADEDYEVYPRYGSVRYRNQWAVSNCERVGRNGIRLELKKLYEGTPSEVIDHWNRFSIDYSEVGEGENIVDKAHRLSLKYFLFGKLFSEFANEVFKLQFQPADIITVDQERVEYTGWADFRDYKYVTNHVDPTLFTKDQFVNRSKHLYILLAENLKEKNIRRIVQHMGFPDDDIQKLRSLKLLELALKYIFVTKTFGLSINSKKEVIVERTKELQYFDFLAGLLALNEIRQLDAHKVGDNTAKLTSALGKLNIEPKTITNNYAEACYQLYDKLEAVFDKINELLSDDH